MPPMLHDELHSNIRHFDVGILPVTYEIEGSPLRVYDLLSELLQYIVLLIFVIARISKMLFISQTTIMNLLRRLRDLLSGKKNWIPEETIEKFMSAKTWEMRAEKLASFAKAFLANLSARH